MDALLISEAEGVADSPFEIERPNSSAMIRDSRSKLT